eukprot:TRINITY_DN4093_c0_g1_i2.p1 TRINITY_DN4093_c0_g1~~TRINITY_DN4093_c0_g1_i2.p1  ORF type:complete len:807 (+),score=178.74 TRINITY_DN4093_c0_g1_i2:54-2474(+)
MTTMLSSRRKTVVEWSDARRFIVGSTSLRIFEIKEKKSTINCGFVVHYPDHRVMEETTISLDVIGSNTDVQNMRCFTLGPQKDQIAVGMGNGHVVITSLLSSGPPTTEFSPRHSRACNVLAWNTALPNFIASGLEKVRNDYSTLIWDVNSYENRLNDSDDSSKDLSGLDNITFNLSRMPSSKSITNASLQLNNSEATIALSWFPSSPHCLATGTGSRWLRTYDLRDKGGGIRTIAAHSKQVHGVVFNPFQHDQIASFSDDGLIKIWDLRRIDKNNSENSKPLLTINTKTKQLAQIGWCPTRSGVIASIAKNESNIKLWDVKPALEQLINKNGVYCEEAESKVKEYMNELQNSPREFPTQGPSASFAWHPKDEYKIITVNNNGTVQLTRMHELIPISLSVNGDICFSSAKDLVEGNPDIRNFGTKFNDLIHDEYKMTEKKNWVDLALQGKLDISYVMKERAKAGYSTDVRKNFESIVPHFKDRKIYNVWKWVYEMKHKFNKGGPFSEIKGTYNVVKTNDGQQESLSNPTKTFKCLVYSSPSRNFCQTICGWGFRNNDYFGEYMSKLEDRGEYSKAAALSLFHFQTQRAMSNLKNQAETSSTENWNAQLVAMALAGYQDAVQSGVSNSDVWRKTCKSLSNQIPDPYFRAMVLFLLQIDMFNTSTATTSTSSSSSTLSDSNIEQPKSHHVDDSSNQEMLFQEILDPKLEISLFDKIAFACRFLKYDQLMKFLHETQERVIAAGDLDGLIITGIDETGKGIDLLRSYLCKTGDIQTAAILAGLVSKRKIKSPCLDEWIMLYVIDHHLCDY